MQLDNFLNKEILVKQVKSGNKLTTKQKGSLIGLGLRGIGSSAELKCSESVLGMVRKIQHIIEISLA